MFIKFAIHVCANFEEAKRGICIYINALCHIPDTCVRVCNWTRNMKHWCWSVNGRPRPMWITPTIATFIDASIVMRNFEKKIVFHTICSLVHVGLGLGSMPSNCILCGCGHTILNSKNWKEVREGHYCGRQTGCYKWTKLPKEETTRCIKGWARLGQEFNNVWGARRSTLPKSIIITMEDKINAIVVVQCVVSDLVTCHLGYVKVYRSYNTPHNTSKLKVWPSHIEVEVQAISKATTFTIENNSNWHFLLLMSHFMVYTCIDCKKQTKNWCQTNYWIN